MGIALKARLAVVASAQLAARSRRGIFMGVTG